MPNPSMDLAAWYRQLADKAGEPRIWQMRMRTADALEDEARRKLKEERVRERAYFLWEREGRPEGRSVAHWLRAEAEIDAQQSLGVTDNGKLLGASAEDPAVLLPRAR